mmetsp:Transcript_149182/g.479137  ORF Transcript_149182/g.479137 Transcript_149182/m.479137 type:complete len:218 (-) Transcript_149182:549-1202(-)
MPQHVRSRHVGHLVPRTPRMFILPIVPISIFVRFLLLVIGFLGTLAVPGEPSIRLLVHLVSLPHRLGLLALMHLRHLDVRGLRQGHRGQLVGALEDHLLVQPRALRLVLDLDDERLLRRRRRTLRGLARPAAGGHEVQQRQLLLRRADVFRGLGHCASQQGKDQLPLHVLVEATAVAPMELVAQDRALLRKEVRDLLVYFLGALVARNLLVALTGGV